MSFILQVTTLCVSSTDEGKSPGSAPVTPEMRRPNQALNQLGRSNVLPHCPGPRGRSGFRRPWEYTIWEVFLKKRCKLRIQVNMYLE